MANQGPTPADTAADARPVVVRACHTMKTDSAKKMTPHIPKAHLSFPEAGSEGGGGGGRRRQVKPSARKSAEAFFQLKLFYFSYSYFSCVYELCFFFLFFPPPIIRMFVTRNYHLHYCSVPSCSIISNNNRCACCLFYLREYYVLKDYFSGGARMVSGREDLLLLQHIS